MNLSLKGKRAIVCGASQGIGRESAIALAAAGASCTLISRDRETLTAVVHELDQTQGQEHRIYSIDMENTAEVSRIANEITKGNNIHIILNNSGGPKPGPIINAEVDEFLSGFRRHVIAAQVLLQAAVGGMKEEGYGRIINIISTSVKAPLPGLGVSNTIRGAMASWAKSMANELAGFGITVNNVLPGMTNTPRLDSLKKQNAEKQNQTIEEVEKQMLKAIPAGRFAEPSETASLVAFLASPSAAYINGTSIPVDGGRTDAL